MNKLFQFSAASSIGVTSTAQSGIRRGWMSAQTLPARDKYHYATVQSLEDSMYPDFRNSSPFPSMEATMDLGHYGPNTLRVSRQKVCYDRYGVAHSAPCAQHPRMEEQTMLSFGFGKKQWT